jgi:hypothetical protein
LPLEQHHKFEKAPSLLPYKGKNGKKPGSSILSRLSLAAQSFYWKNCGWPFLALVPKFLKSKILPKKKD